MQAAARNLPSRALGQLHTYLLRDNRQAARRNLPSRAFVQLHTNLLRDNRQEAARIIFYLHEHLANFTQIFFKSSGEKSTKIYCPSEEIIGELANGRVNYLCDE